MVSGSDAAYLISNLRRNRVVLFLGAGFSHDAKNFRNDPLPLAKDLAEALWPLANFDGPYDGTELRYMYDAARHKTSDVTVRTLLRDLLTVSSYPDWYRLVPRWFWYRIYTANIDNLIESLYSAVPGSPRLHPIIATSDDYGERDMLLRRIQYVKLHGSAADLEKPVTFSPIEYGKRASLHDTWYDHFLRDYATHPTLLIGTQLDEPLFWQYLAARQERPKGAPESRPKSFLITPNITKGRMEALASYNIQGISVTAEEFFDWLAQQPDSQMPREAILLELDPTLDQLLALEKSGAPRTSLDAAQFFFETFQQVRELDSAATGRRDFLLGVAPSWSDIGRQLDADREVTHKIVNTLREMYHSSSSDDVLVVYGAAGSGKSTSLMRGAYTLALEGNPVYFATGRTRPDPAPLAQYLETLNTRPIVVFDNAATDLWQIQELRTRLKDSRIAPLFVVGLRQNEWFQKRYILADEAGIRAIQMSDLSPFDIDQILAVLEREGLLGALGKLSVEQRREVFREKSKKQLLVSMREATRGQGFDEILRDEYQAIEDQTARLLYLIVGLPTMHQFDIGPDQMISALDSSPAETMTLLRQKLSGIVVSRIDTADRYVVRHSVIAEYVIVNVAPRALLADAYVRYLQVIAHEMIPDAAPRRSRLFRLSQVLLNHETLHTMFQQNPEFSRHIYDSVREHYGENGHFWLQYGAYELAYGQLDIAENYLLQAQGLIPKHEQLATTLGHLYLRKAIEAGSLAAAQEFRAKGEEILRQQIARIGSRDPYPYHVLGSQLLGYINAWIPQGERAAAIRDLQGTVVTPGAERHPLAGDLKRLAADCKRAELMSAVVRK